MATCLIDVIVTVLFQRLVLYEKMMIVRQDKPICWKTVPFSSVASTLDTFQSSKNIPLFVVTWSPRFNSKELVQVTSYDWLIDVLLVSRFGLVEENVVEIAITILFTSPRLS
jgi:hypothetical protein